MWVTMCEPSLSVASLAVRLGGQLIFSNLEFSACGRGLLQVLGPNGAGKTTLLRAILGLVKPLKGRILLNGVDVTGKPKAAGRLVGYVPQHDEPELSYPLTAWDVVEQEFLLKSAGWPRLLRGLDSSAAVSSALELVGLDKSLWRRALSSLSGGERQRVLLARALVCKPSILLLDEPLGPIDPKGRLEIVGLLGELSRRMLVVVTSHDPSALLEHTRWVLLLNRRAFYFGAPKEALVESTLKSVYGFEARVELARFLGSVEGSCKCA